MTDPRTFPMLATTTNAHTGCAACWTRYTKTISDCAGKTVAAIRALKKRLTYAIRWLHQNIPPTDFTSEATPSRIDPAPLRTPFVVPHDVNKTEERTTKQTQIVRILPTFYRILLAKL